MRAGFRTREIRWNSWVIHSRWNLRTAGGSNVSRSLFRNRQQHATMNNLSPLLKPWRRLPGAVVLCIILLAACSDPPMPKPRAYFRIDLPEKEYTVYESSCPFSMEVPQYSRVQLEPGAQSKDS